MFTWVEGSYTLSGSVSPLSAMKLENKLSSLAEDMNSSFGPKKLPGLESRK